MSFSKNDETLDGFETIQDLVVDGGMIAYLGEIIFRKGIFVEAEDVDEVDVDPRERTDMVDVVWKQLGKDLYIMDV